MKSEAYYPSNDLEVAFMFLPELDHKHLNLVVNSVQHLPFVRRAIYRLAGEPNRAMQMELVYPRFTVRLIVNSGVDKTRGLQESNTFLIETWGDN